MSAVEWSKRNSKTNRISYSQFLSDLASGRQSQSVERPSRIPLRSFSQSGRDRGLPNPTKQRSKSQLVTGNSETPLSHVKYTPQIGSKLLSGASSNASSKKPTYYKDPRNLQDKDFLKEASHLVQSYFQQKCPEILINNTDIKPMTIKMFIAMINHLFDVLTIFDKGIESVRFAVSTYEKEVPYWMKKLEYPGLITKAWLQTVNVPQYWPHVVGLLSWLVKLYSVNSMFNIEEQLNFPIQYLNEWWGVFFFKKSMEAFCYYNEGKEEEYKELCSEVINKFRELNGVKKDAMDAMEEEILELKKKLEDPTLLADKDAYDEMEQQLRVLKTQHLKLVDDIEKKEIYIEELKKKISKNEKNCLLIKNDIDDTRKEIENLKTKISAQSTSVEDIADIQKKISYIDKEIKCLEKECQDYSRLLSTYDVEAAQIQDNILQSSHAFNRSIIQLEQMIPELKKFHIHIDLETEGADTRMEEMVKSLDGLKNTYFEKYQKLEDELVESEQTISNKKHHLEELLSTFKTLENKREMKEAESIKLQNTFDEKESLLKEEAKTWEEKIIAVQEKLKKLDDLKENKKKMEARLDSLTRALDGKEQFWFEFWNKLEEKWKFIPGTLESLLEMVNKKNEELEATVAKDKIVEGFEIKKHF